MIALLKERQLEVEDCGCDGERADYPVIAKAVGAAVASHSGDMGILICGTGIGMSIAANKIRGVRAALCADAFSTKYTRLHNDANVMCMGARTLGSGLALELVEIFLDTPFEGGRHEKACAYDHRTGTGMVTQEEKNYGRNSCSRSPAGAA